MASSGIIPRSAFQTKKPQSARSMRTVNKVPVIPHPMTKMGDVSELMITGTASPEVRSRPQTVSGYPVNLVSCFSWSESDLVSTTKRRYTKKALVTGTRADSELLELVTERLVDGLQGVRQMFKARDPAGGETVTQDNLQRIMYVLVGQIDRDAFQRMLLNLGLNKKERISFDMFVSRFSEIEDVRRQWMTPVKRAALADTLQKAHPEEELRDIDVHGWAQLKVAPHAAQILFKALSQGKMDLRGLLPDECFLPGGTVGKLQMRYALLDLGINLTDNEYRRFWEKLDRKNAGHVSMQELYAIFNLTPDGEPKKSARPSSAARARPKKLPRSKTDMAAQPRPAAMAAREFTLNKHRQGGGGGGGGGGAAKGKKKGGGGGGGRGVLVGDAFRVEGIRPQSARLADRGNGGLIEGEMCGGAGEMCGGAGEMCGGAGEMCGGAGQMCGGAGQDMSDAEAGSKIRAVMQQRQHSSKFDSIRDCLHHKFEEHYVSMMMAFKLFDIHEDGHVMRIDFRRVLKEFGFPVTAVQLGLLVQRFGVIMKQGLISYKQLLTKLFSHAEPVTSRAMDDYLQQRLDGVGADTGSEDSDEDGIVRRVAEFLHQEYLDLALFFLRCDRRNKGTILAADMRSGVERCLGYPMTDRQWAELQIKIPRDPDGSLRYVDFLLSFSNGGPGAWNLQKVGQVAVPRNKVLYQPSLEVLRLQRAKTDLGPRPLATKDEHRPLEQLRKELEEFFSQHLFEVEQRFRELDRKSHSGFTQWQFGALLNLCGFPMTDHEVSSCWASLKLDSDHTTFDDLVRLFLPGYGLTGTTTAWPEKDGRSGQHTSRQAVYGGSAWTGKTITWGSSSPAKRAVTARPSPSTSPFLTSVMVKVKPAVTNKWEYLRRGFRACDPNGLSSVTFQQMQRLVKGLRAGLSIEEVNQLCEEFDFRKNGRCNYMAFMKTFAPQPASRSQMAYDPQVRVLEKKPTDSSEPLTVNDALTRIRKKLIKQYKSLRRGFTTNDRSKSGSLGPDDVRRMLGDCGIPVSDSDFLDLMSELDSDMDGRVSYSEFLDALLRMA